MDEGILKMDFSHPCYDFYYSSDDDVPTLPPVEPSYKAPSVWQLFKKYRALKKSKGYEQQRNLVDYGVTKTPSIWHLMKKYHHLKNKEN